MNNIIMYMAGERIESGQAVYVGDDNKLYLCKSETIIKRSDNSESTPKEQPMKDWTKNIGTGCTHPEYVKWLEGQRRIFLEALEFYADDRRWFGGDMVVDIGEIARQAIKQAKEE